MQNVVQHQPCLLIEPPSQGRTSDGVPRKAHPAAPFLLPAPELGVDSSPLPSHSSPRFLFLDLLRGVAIILMIVDHVALQFPSSGVAFAIRHTSSVFACPLFFVVAGGLWAERDGVRRSRRSVQRIALAAFFGGPAAVLAGLPWLDILLLFGICSICRRQVVRHPIAFLCAGLLQTKNWYVAGLPNYPIGYLFAWLSIGVLSFSHLRPHSSFVLFQNWAAKPSLRPLCELGKRPLFMYFLHLGVLALFRGLHAFPS